LPVLGPKFAEPLPPFILSVCVVVTLISSSNISEVGCTRNMHSERPPLELLLVRRAHDLAFLADRTAGRVSGTDLRVGDLAEFFLDLGRNFHTLPHKVPKSVLSKISAVC